MLWENEMGLGRKDRLLESQEKRDQLWKRLDVSWNKVYRVRASLYKIHLQQWPQTSPMPIIWAKMPIDKVSFFKPPSAERSFSSQYHYLGYVWLLVTHCKWGRRVHGRYISFPGSELQALAGDRGRVRKDRELPWHLLSALILECSLNVFRTEPRSLETFGPAQPLLTSRLDPFFPLRFYNKTSG